jgi:predicted nucleic acid-binding OB-fold protein
VPNGKRKKFNVYAEMKERCEAKLAEMIAEKKAEIAEKKAKQKEGAE